MRGFVEYWIFSASAAFSLFTLGPRSFVLFLRVMFVGGDIFIWILSFILLVKYCVDLVIILNYIGLYRYKIYTDLSFWDRRKLHVIVRIILVKILRK